MRFDSPFGHGNFNKQEYNSIEFAFFFLLRSSINAYSRSLRSLEIRRSSRRFTTFSASSISLSFLSSWSLIEYHVCAFRGVLKPSYIVDSKINNTPSKSPHKPLSFFTKVTTIRLTAARDHVQFSGTIWSWSCNFKTNVLLVDGLHRRDYIELYQFASNKSIESVKLSEISSQPKVAGASHLWASLIFKSTYILFILWKMLLLIILLPIDKQEQ